MASAASGPETKLQVRRTFAARRETVFAAWTERQHLERWMCRPDPRNVTQYLEFDLREGGKHLLEVRLPNGHRYLNKGSYQVIRPPEKLVFTWAWEYFDAEGKKIGELTGTLVTVEFHDRAGATDVVLTHEFFPDPATRDSHNNGWNGCVELLGQYLQG
jgi:uncharacterized protein YndB with AHSA1/START domain